MNKLRKNEKKKNFAKRIKIERKDPNDKRWKNERR